MTAPDLEAQSLVDPFLLHHLDEDWAVPCEMVSHRDDSRPPAEWIVHLQPCCPEAPERELWCTACRDHVLAARSCSCAICGHVWLPAATAFVSIEPLNRRTT